MQRSCVAQVKGGRSGLLRVPQRISHWRGLQARGTGDGGAQGEERLLCGLVCLFSSSGSCFRQLS